MNYRRSDVAREYVVIQFESQDSWEACHLDGKG